MRFAKGDCVILKIEYSFNDGRKIPKNSKGKVQRDGTELGNDIFYPVVFEGFSTSNIINEKDIDACS